MLQLLRAGMALRTVLGLALAADTASITVMEIVDNAVMLLMPGAIEKRAGAGGAGPVRETQKKGR